MAERARDWRHAAHAAVCDVLEPWAHGTVARATRYPSYYDFNVVRVERDPAMSVDELIAFADTALSGLEHRRLDFELADVAQPLRAQFEQRGWRTDRLVWMHHDVPLPHAPDASVEAVPYDAVHELRVAWFEEDFPGLETGAYFKAAEDVARRRNVQVLAQHDGGRPISFAQLERDGAGAEITQVYVHPDHRGGGLGTTLTTAAIRAAGDVRDLWIVADDEDRPKELYARLGFRPAWTAIDATKLP